MKIQLKLNFKELFNDNKSNYNMVINSYYDSQQKHKKEF